MVTYSTIQGDMWDSIAHKTLGDTKYMDKVIDANPQLREYYIFPAGVTITIPEITEKRDSGLPPWKKVLG